MSDTPSHGPVNSIMPKWVRCPQDFVGGLALVAIAAFALWASSDLQGMRGFSFGAGTAPRMFGVLLLLLGVGISVMGLLFEGPQVAKYHWRGPFFVSLSILCFAVAIRPLASSSRRSSPSWLREWERWRRGGRKPSSSASA